LTIFLGLVLILLGVMAGIYAILPVSRAVHWRYPLDVGFVRGVTAVAIGILVMFNAIKTWRARSETPMSINTLFLLIAVILLLLIALSRNVFYGWYLLWSIPLLLLLKDRRLGLTVLLCLLLVYPSYTHDNFVSLGFEEERLWEDEMYNVSAWTTFVNTTSSSANTSLVSMGVNTNVHNNSGEFWFDTSSLTKADLENLSLHYSIDVVIYMDHNIEFVARIISDWNPTFGRYAELRLDYDGVDQNGTAIHGHIIDRTTIFTNLTYILWRSAVTAQTNVENITIHRLSFVIYPIEAVISQYEIDFLYTTYYGILNPIYFLMVPALVALALVAFTFLHLELEYLLNDTKETISESSKSSA
jgi:hypothetical protein